MTTYDAKTREGPINPLDLIYNAFGAINVTERFQAPDNTKAADFLRNLYGEMRKLEEQHKTLLVIHAIKDVLPVLPVYYRKKAADIDITAPSRTKQSELDKLNAEYVTLLDKFIGYVKSSIQAHRMPLRKEFLDYAGIFDPEEGKAARIVYNAEYIRRILSEEQKKLLDIAKEKAKRAGKHLADIAISNGELYSAVIRTIEKDVGPFFKVEYGGPRGGGTGRVVIFARDDSQPQNAHLNYSKGNVPDMEYELLMAIGAHIDLNPNVSQSNRMATRRAISDIREHLR